MSAPAPFDDFWLDPPRFPLDAYGNSRYGDVNPAHPSWIRSQNWLDQGRDGEYLRAIETKWVYIHPVNNKLWRLAGQGKGREGVALVSDLTGVMQPEFEQKYIEGPYIVGSLPARVNWRKRTINMGVVIQPNANPDRPQVSPFAYRLIEQAWWASWSEEVPGFLGSFTRTHGWRWLKVLLGEATKDSIKFDPVANGNNMAQWNMTVHAPYPMYAKPSLTAAWVPDQNQFINGRAVGLLQIANRGTWESYPKFIVKGPGVVTIQDGIDGPMVQMPTLFPEDGEEMLVDTDPQRRTITTEKDPVDSQFWKALRNSHLLDIILNDVLESKVPAQRRIPGGVGFNNSIPPRTVAHLKVTHSNPQGAITVIMPQQYKMAWS